jgi:archaellum biogenesis protein FlaJ (TadC family)
MLMKPRLADDNGKAKISEAAPLLDRVGYTLTETANIFAKKTPSEVLQYLIQRNR